MKEILGTLRIPVTVLGALGLLCTLYIHLNAIDYAEVAEGDSIPGFLRLGLLVVWPAAIAMVWVRQGELKVDHPDLGRLKLLFKSLFGEAPNLVIMAAIAAYIYGTYYGWTFHFEGITGIIDEKLVLHNHGHIIRELKTDEFLQYKAEEIRLKTSNLLIFYAIGTCILFPPLSKIEV